jgi:adenylosuccinate synthase
MTATAVVGANWGDEGKGKITDMLAADAAYVVRFQGGNNAGHTIINGYGKFALHLLPSGVFYPHTTNILGPGVALNAQAFLDELETLEQASVPAPKIAISDRAQVVMPFHPLLDAYEEKRLGQNQFGSTKAGIAPFYADKYAKLGVQVADLSDPVRLRQRLEHSLTGKNVLFEHLYGMPTLKAEELVPSLLEYGRRLAPYICDTVDLLHQGLDAGEHILVEGQLGALRDPDHGIYPFPSSSSPLAGFAAVGAGIPPHRIRRIVAVAKAYSSCVGAGPFVTELDEKPGDELRRRGGDDGEYGATTGRPRRMGWFDAVATRYGCRVQGATEVALTLLDVLGYLEEIPVCVAYQIDGAQTQRFPVPRDLDRARPVYRNLPGWRQDISAVRSFEELPAAAQDYVLAVETMIGVPIRYISVGPQREATIDRGAIA